MKPLDFFNEVARLRDLQKQYFKTRIPSVLSACKRQEKLIDEEIARVRKQIEPDGQLKF